jgi:hypothetical protein
MATFIWINQQYIKTFTPLNANIDTNEIAPHIETAQLIHTREILGMNLYNDLASKIQAGTLNVKETELVDIIKQALAYRAAEISIPFLSIKLRNKGAVKMRDEFADPASLDEMKYLRSELNQRAAYFEDRAKDYICQFRVDFPLYTQYNDNQILPNYNNAFNDEIYIDREDWEIKRNRYFYGPNGSFPNRGY